MKKIMLAMFVLGLSTSASASLFNFGVDNWGDDYTFHNQNLGIQYGDVVSGASMLVDGITLNLSPVLVDLDSYGNAIGYSQLSSQDYPNGGMWVGHDDLGVTTSGSGTKIDGGDPFEGILFSFDQAVSLDWINFDNFDTVSVAGSNAWNDDGFNLTVNNVDLMADVRSLDTNSNLFSWQSNGDEPHFTGVTGTQFVIWANDSYDIFRVDSMAVTAVPEPSIVSLFGLGWLAIFFAGRRRKELKA